MNVTEANQILKECGIEGELEWSSDYAERIYAEYIRRGKKNQTVSKECENTGCVAGGGSATKLKEKK